MPKKLVDEARLFFELMLEHSLRQAFFFFCLRQGLHFLLQTSLLSRDFLRETEESKKTEPLSPTRDRERERDRAKGEAERKSILEYIERETPRGKNSTV